MIVMASQNAPISLRLPTKAATWLEDTRAEHEISRSDLLRAVINVARRHPEELQARIQDLT